MKKIAFLVYDISLTGGAERVAENLAEKLSEIYETHLISVFNEKRVGGENHKYKTYFVSEKTVSLSFHCLSVSRKIRKYMKDNGIDVLFSITAGVNTIAVLSTWGTKVKTVYCEHSNLENGTYGLKHRLRQRIGAKRQDKVVALTERDAENFRNKYKLKREKVVAIANWFEPDFIDVNACKKGKAIITVGRLEKVKGYDLLLQVAEKVKGKHPDWSWDVFGEGSLKNYIEEEIVARKLKGFLNLRGNSSELGNEYGKYEFLVATSYYEGFPLAFLEAQTAGLPIVSFDCPTGPSEIVSDNENGFLVKPYDTEELADKVNLLIEDPQMLKEFSLKSGIKLGEYTREKILKKWTELIELL